MFYFQTQAEEDVKEWTGWGLENCWLCSAGCLTKEMLFQKARAEIMLEDVGSLQKTMVLAAEHNLDEIIEEMLYHFDWEPHVSSVP